MLILLQSSWLALSYSQRLLYVSEIALFIAFVDSLNPLQIRGERKRANKRARNGVNWVRKVSTGNHQRMPRLHYPETHHRPPVSPTLASFPNYISLCIICSCKKLSIALFLFTLHFRSLFLHFCAFLYKVYPFNVFLLNHNATKHFFCNWLSMIKHIFLKSSCECSGRQKL